jgi:predicted TPR repeat methyltransferase
LQLKPDQNYHQQAVAVFDKYAQKYLDTYQNVPTYLASYDAFLPFIPFQTGQVLELGCGTGMISKYLVSKGTKHQITLTDLSAAMLQIAAQEVPAAKTCLLDARYPKALNQSFDGIVAGFVLPYIQAEEAVLWFKELAACLVPNGALYISYLQADPSESGYKRSSDKQSGCFQFFYQLPWIEQQLMQAGFTVHIGADTSPSPDTDPKQVYVIATRTQ